MMRLRYVLLVFAAAALLSTANGCSRDKLTRQNYDIVQERMYTNQEVEHLLGAPTHRLPESWIYQRPDKHLIVIFDFDEQGRVTRKRWNDALNVDLHDSADRKPAGR